MTPTPPLPTNSSSRRSPGVFNAMALSSCQALRNPRAACMAQRLRAKTSIYRRRQTSMAMNKRSTVVGVFDSQARAHQAVAELHKAGFKADQIGFAMRDGMPATGATAGEGTLPGRGTDSQAAEGAATGAVLGGLL